MKPGSIWGAICFLCLPGLVDAHVGDRIYPIIYLNDEMVDEIKLDDGMVDEWYEAVGDPNLTTSDFTEKMRNEPFAPSDLDFRIWLAWHDDPARFYLAFVSSDDAYQNTHDYGGNFPHNFIFTHDSVGLVVDGDHNGGPDLSPDPTLEEHEEYLGRTQYYYAISRTASGPTMDVPIIRENTGSSWTALLPYGEAGGGVFGEAPVISTIELFVTPFNGWEGWDSPGEIEVSELISGQVIGFGIQVFDYDPSEEWASWTPGLMPALPGPDDLLDGVLMGPGLSVPQGDSAVESVSWMRIKASMEVD